MALTKDSKSKARKLGYGSLLLAALLLTAVTLAISADDRKVETIDATAMGTSTQLGKIVNVKVTIYEFSTRKIARSSSMPSRKVRIRDWSTLSPR